MPPVALAPSGDDAPFGDAVHEVVVEAAEALEDLLRQAADICAGVGCCGSLLNLAHAKLDEKAFENAKDAVKTALEDLKLALAMDTNAVVHRTEDKVDALQSELKRRVAYCCMWSRLASV